MLTVCEVRGDHNRYADAAIAVVGRMERSVSLIDHYERLSQGRCKHPVRRKDVAAKLQTVRKTTKLGSHQEPRFHAAGRPTWIDVPNQWAVVYGHVVRDPRLDEDCRPGGCGGDGVPLFIIAEPDQIHTLTADGMLLPDDQRSPL